MVEKPTKMKRMQKDETKFRIVVWVWVLLLGVWLPSVRADERVSAISPEATAQVGVVLRCSDAALEGENEKSISADDFAKDPYWTAVFQLGELITPEELGELERAESLTVEECLALGAVRCFKNRTRLEELIEAYRVGYCMQPHKNGATMLEMAPRHATAADRSYWEMLLLSPCIENISVSRCVEALTLCGNRFTLPVLDRASSRLIAGGIRQIAVRDNYFSVGQFASGATCNWLRLIEMVDAGGASGLRALLAAHAELETRYPELASMKRFEGSALYFPSDKGTSEYLFEVAYVRKNKEGNWIWEEAFRELDATTLSARQKEIVALMIAQFDQNR